MERYLIKTTYDATQNNTCNYGTKDAHQEWYSMIGGYVSNQLDTYTINRGYTRMCDAKRVLKREIEYAKDEEARGGWLVKKEIIKVETYFWQ